MTRHTVGCAIPSIPSRSHYLARALRSVAAQTTPCDQIAVALDTTGVGAAVCRDVAWRSLTTDWVAFLDDDDEWLPHHVEALVACAVREEADMVYPWFTVVGGTDPIEQWFGVPFDPEHPASTTITCLWRRAALETIGGFEAARQNYPTRKTVLGEDKFALLRLVEAGARIVHLPERTWLWHHHGGNTSGLPTKGDSLRAGFGVE